MSKKTPKYVHVKNKIKENIRNDVITDKLPGERVLAKKLGVSYMTVRRAVTELVEEGILHKFTTKGTFVSNNRHSPKTTHNIGFFLDEGIREGISSPYYSLVFKTLAKEIKQHGYNILLFPDSENINPLDKQKKIDGVIICSFPRIENKIQEIKKMLPVVLLDNIASDKSIPSVTIDNFNSCRNATSYLRSLGHRRIGFISGLLDSDISNDRLLGYANALQHHKIKEDKKLVYQGDYSYESGESGAEYFLSLKNPPTAILCANDSMAIGAMKKIREKGLSIPEDISVIGFDDIEVAARVFPPLTTNAAPIKDIAQKATELLISSIKGEEVEYKHIILPAKLIERDSCSEPKQTP
jgi:DNA-binding LacI/PurR family transcriptional regulator